MTGEEIDYEATCPCGYVLVAPRGRIMRGSAAWSRSNGAGRAAALARAARERREAES